MDMDDLPIINRNNFYLLDCCHAYFKRELPADHWRLFSENAVMQIFRRLRFRRGATFGKSWPRFNRSHRLPQRFRRLPVPAAEKPTDVFFAGQVAESSTVRTRGLSELLLLRDKGVVDDIPDGPVPPDEFISAVRRRAWSGRRKVSAGTVSGIMRRLHVTPCRSSTSPATIATGYWCRTSIALLTNARDA